MKRILLLTDFSESSKRAFHKTADLARRLDLGVTLLYVVPDLRTVPHGATFAPPQSNPELAHDLATAKADMEAVVEELPGDVDVQTDVVTGEFVARTVADYVREHEVEFIALSTHGRTGLRRFFVGSVAEEVVRYASVPVMTFPPSDEP